MCVAITFILVLSSAKDLARLGSLPAARSAVVAHGTGCISLWLAL